MWTSGKFEDFMRGEICIKLLEEDRTGSYKNIFEYFKQGIATIQIN